MDKLRQDYQWTQPLDELKATSPSAKDGIPFVEELRDQGKSANFIVKISTILKLPPITIFTATLFLHRFYLKYSLKRVQYYEAGAACVFLAAKTGETPRRIKEVAAACALVATKVNVNPHEDSKELRSWVDCIMYTEQLLLEALLFDFDVDSPYLELKRLSESLEVEDTDALGSKALNFVNDSCRTMLGLIYLPKVIAAAALFWAIKDVKVQVADDWIQREDLDKQTLVEAVNLLCEMIPIARGGILDGQAYEKLID